MRCGIFSEDKIFNPADWVGELTPKEIAKRDRERARKINPKGAYVQLKADGTYREFTMEDDTVSCTSRTGEEYTYPLIFKEMEGYPDGKYPGELTVRGVTDRAIANGMINSSNPPHKDIMVQFWDHITLEEYHNVTNKVKNTTPYDRRFRLLIAIIDEHEYTDGHISPIPYEIVNSVQEALKATAEWMKEGYEGSIYKDASALFRDGTNLQQLKLKLEITLSMRATGYVAGNKGSKNEAYFSAITFENDEKTIQGQIGVTTMTEKQRDWFHNNRSTVISSIIDVQCNDLTKGRNNDYYALSHPRFDERRSDVTETDTLERALELRDSAMMLGL